MGSIESGTISQISPGSIRYRGLISHLLVDLISHLFPGTTLWNVLAAILVPALQTPMPHWQCDFEDDNLVQGGGGGGLNKTSRYFLVIVTSCPPYTPQHPYSTSHC